MRIHCVMRMPIQQRHSGADTTPADATTTPLQVRWLATLCGVSASGPLPWLASALIAKGDPDALAHIASWARNPDVGSNFARAVGSLPDVPDAHLAVLLGKKGYDGLLYVDGRRIVGHSFFQRHGSELHLFAVWLAEQHRDGKFMAAVGFDFLAYASQSGVKCAKIGSSRNADRVLAPLNAVSAGLNWRMRPDGWVDFSRDEE